MIYYFSAYFSTPGERRRLCHTGAAFFMLWFRLRWQRAVGVADWGG